MLDPRLPRTTTALSRTPLRAFAAASPLAIACVVAACGAPAVETPPPQKPAPRPVATSHATATSTATAISDECRAALPKLEKLASDTTSSSFERCELQGADAALQRCPDLAGRFAGPVAERWKKRRDAHGEVDVRGKWLLESAGIDDTRIFELGPAKATLRARIERGEVRLLGGGRALVTTDDGIFVVDLAKGIRRGVQKGWFLAETEKYVYVADAQNAYRLLASDLSVQATVAWSGKGDVDRGPGHVLDDGKAIVAAGMLVGFEPPRVIRRDIVFGASGPDDKRFLACDEAASQVVEIDAATGNVSGHMKYQGMECGAIDTAGNSTPIYTPDGHHAYWFEHGKELKDGAVPLVIALGDTKTGTVKRLATKGETWGIAFSSRPFIDSATGLLCTSLSATHSSSDYCDWKATSDGRVSQASRPAPQPPIAKMLPADLEASRAYSPSGERVAVLSYKSLGGEKHDLRVTVASKKGKILITQVLQAESFSVDSEGDGLVEAWLPFPSVAFFGEDRVAVFKGLHALQASQLVDLPTRKVTDLCAAEDQCTQVDRYVTLGGGRLLDPASGQTISLTATEPEWTSAYGTPAPCP